MLQPTMDTLLGDDFGACLAPPDPPHMGTFARRAPVRGTGLAAPTARAATLPSSAVAARSGGPLALGRPEEVANLALFLASDERVRTLPAPTSWSMAA